MNLRMLVELKWLNIRIFAATLYLLRKNLC